MQFHGTFACFKEQLFVTVGMTCSCSAFLNHCLDIKIVQHLLSHKRGMYVKHRMNHLSYMAVFIATAIEMSLLFSCSSSVPPKKQGLQVSGSPSGKIVDTPTIRLAFEEKMIQESQIGKKTDLPLAFSPQLEGNLLWTDGKTATFTPTTTLDDSTRYVATLKKGVTSVSGNVLFEDYQFDFSTKAIVAGVSLVGLSNHAVAEQVIRVSFPQNVPFKELATRCRYQSKKQTQAIKLDKDSELGPSKSYRIVPKEKLTLDTNWTFVCDAGIRGTQGNIGTAVEQSVKFHTYGPLTFKKNYPSGDDIVPEEDLRLSLEFSNPLAKPYRVSIEPKLPGFPSRCHSLGTDPAGLDCSALLEAKTRYKVTFSPKQKDIFGQTLGKKTVIKFRTSDAKPAISMDDGYFVAELTRPVLPVFTRNVKKIQVTAVKITPANFHQLRPLINWWDNEPTDFSKSPLKPIDRVIKVKSKENRWHQEAIDAASLFGKEPGPGMYFMEIGSPNVEKGNFYQDGREKVLANFTNIGVVSKISPVKGLVWATELSTGKPLPGAKVHVRNAKGKVTWRGTTDTNGLAQLPPSKKLMSSSSSQAEQTAAEYNDYSDSLDVFVEKGTDWSMVNAKRSGGLAVSNFNMSKDYNMASVQLRGFMHTDRGLYRPGDTVHIKGLARETSLGETLRVPKQRKAKAVIIDARGNSIEEIDVKLSRFGGFWFDVNLTKDARLGDYTVRADFENGKFSRRFSVEEYRPATFEVTGKAKQSRIVRKGDLKATIAANYFYGAPINEGNVRMTVHSRPRTVKFKEFSDFNFSNWRYWDSYYHSSSNSERLIVQDQIALDDKGNARFTVPLSSEDIYTDADILVRASVTGPSNEVNSKSFTVPYFRSRRYFGIKSSKYFLQTDKSHTIQVVGLTPSGKVADVSATVTIEYRDWNCLWEDWGYRGSYQCNEEKQVVLKEKVEFKGQPIPISFTPQKGGDYLVTIKGDKAQFSNASMELYAYGGGGGYKSDDSLTFNIITDKKEYHQGDVATLALKTDLSKATGLVTIERDGIIETRLVEISENTKHINVPILDNYAPNIYVSVALIQGRMGKGRRGKPRMRMGMTNLAVRPDNNKLKVQVSTDSKDYRPGKPVTATITVTDKEGQPVSAEVAVTAADEGVLALIGYRTPNPIPTFYAPFGISVDTATQYAYIRDIPGPNLVRPATGGDSAALGTLRSRFMATAIWQPAVVTDAQGQATVTFDAPDNLTAYRVMAVAADKGHRFGSSDKRVTVSKPLQLHQFLPRFLSLQDTLIGGVVVHNDSDKAGEATVSVSSNDKISIAGQTSQTIQIKKGGRIPVLFSMKAAALGEAKLTFSAKMNQHQDAVIFKLPVHHPSPELTKQIKHGRTNQPIEIPFSVPSNAISGFSYATVSVDPHGLAGIESSLYSLIGYPYGCLEQTTSKVIPMITAKNLVKLLNLESLPESKIDKFVEAGIAKIGRHQTANGGYSLWPGGTASAYYTGYALWGLYLAKEAGYKVDPARIKDGLQYLKYRASKADTSSDWYDRSGDLSNQAFALYIRAALGDKDAGSVTRLIEKANELTLYGKGYLLKAILATLGSADPAAVALTKELSKLANDAAKKKSLIGEQNSERLYWYMSSNIRTTAIVLDALISADPKNSAIVPLAKVLMEKRRSRSYLSTQSNIYSLLALVHYMDSRADKNVSVSIKLDGESLLETTLTPQQQFQLVTANITKPSGTLSITASDNVFYDAQIRYREKLNSISAANNGLGITREYLDESGNPKTSFKTGDIVHVKLTLPLNNSASHLMVADRIPAGFEVLNTKFSTVGGADVKESKNWRTFREIRDERVDFSTEYTWGHTLRYQYTARAIAQGKFVIPPTVGELMYQPEVNGRTDLKYIEIKGK